MNLNFPNIVQMKMPQSCLGELWETVEKQERGSHTIRLRAPSLALAQLFLEKDRESQPGVFQIFLNHNSSQYHHLIMQ